MWLVRNCIIFLVLTSGCSGADRDYKDALNFSLSGTAHLESPIVGADVTVFELDGKKRGDLVAKGTTGEAGEFSVDVRTRTAGPWLVEVAGLAATYHDAATGQPVRFNLEDFVSTTVATQPEDTTPIAINALTTLGVALTDALTGVAGIGEFADARALVLTLLGEHLQRPGAITIETTVGSNFAQDPSADRTDTLLVGLFHVGLSRWGADTSLSQGLAPGALPSLRVLGLLMSDAENGVFDGKDAIGNNVWTHPNKAKKLTTDTLRSELASSIEHWLDNVALWDGDEGQNATSLTAEPYRVRNGFFDQLAGDSSILFGDAGVLFDRDGPEIFIEQPAEGQVVAGALIVRATASDPSGLLDLTVALPQTDPEKAQMALGVDVWTSQPEVLEIPIDTTILSDGSLHVDLVAEDTLGNTTTVTRVVTVDNRAPVLTLEAPSVVAQGTVTVTGTLDAGDASVDRIEVYLGELMIQVLSNPDASFEIELSFSCNIAHSLTLVAFDAAGHRSEVRRTIECDAFDPAIVLQTGTYRPASTLDVVESGAGLSYDPADLPKTDLAVAPWPLTFEKYFNRLDYLPDQGRGVESNNLPAWRFLATDTDSGSGQGGVSTVPSALVVDYRYSLNGGVVRDWTVLPYPGAGLAYELPLSYQTLDPILGRTAVTDEHLVELRVTDAAGRVTVHAYPFFMQLVSPPVLLSGCSMNGALNQYNLMDDSMSLFYLLSRMRLWSGSLRYPLDLPEGSLAPTDSVGVDWSSAGIETRVTELKEYVYQPYEIRHSSTAGYYSVFFEANSRFDVQQPICAVRAPNAGSTCAEGAWFSRGTDGDETECQPGHPVMARWCHGPGVGWVGPDGVIVCDPGTNGFNRYWDASMTQPPPGTVVPASVVHASEMRLQQHGVEVVPGFDGRRALGPDADASVELDVVAPSFVDLLALAEFPDFAAYHWGADSGRMYQEVWHDLNGVYPDPQHWACYARWQSEIFVNELEIVVSRPDVASQPVFSHPVVGTVAARVDGSCAEREFRYGSIEGY